MFTVFKVIKKLINKLDLFSSIQLLRFDGDAQTKTFTGGIISFGLMIYIMSTFSTMILDTFDKVVIQSTSNTDQDDEPQPVYLTTQNNASNFMMGVEVWHFDLNTGPRYFDVLMRNSYMVNGIPGDKSILYTLEACTKDHFRALSNIEAIFQKVQMGTWLCMPLNVAPILQGKYFSDLQTTFDIVLSACKNESDPNRPCATQEEIDTFMNQNSPFYFTPFFYNPLINPQSQDYLSIYLQDKYYTMFGPGYGMQMYVYNSAYQITTDQSILPLTQTHYQNGSIITKVSTSAYQLGNNSDIYAFISFFRDPSTLIYARNYQKIIDALSYVGGLLGSFLLVLIFLNFYNECSYEMRFASMYKIEKDCPTTPKKFNICYYFLQAIYNLLQIVKVKCEKWRVVKYFHETKEEMVRQLDVKYLFKKLHILQNAMMLLLTKSQIHGLMLQHEMTVSEAKKTRKIYNLKSKVKKILKEKLKKSQEDKQKKQQSFFDISVQKMVQNSDKKEQFFSNPALVTPSNNPSQNQDIRNLSSQSQDSSESDQDQQTQQILIQDINKLKQESEHNNKISQTILRNLDPIVKKMYQRCYQSKDKGQKAIKQVQLQSYNLQQNIETFNLDKGSPRNGILRKRKKLSKVNEQDQRFEENGQVKVDQNGFFFFTD